MTSFDFGQNDYIAANLAEALKLIPDTGDWHGILRHWCEQSRGDKTPNQTAEEMLRTIFANWVVPSIDGKDITITGWHKKGPHSL